MNGFSRNGVIATLAVATTLGFAACGGDDEDAAAASADATAEGSAGGDAVTITTSPVVSGRDQWERVDEERTPWLLDELKRVHPDLTIPLLPSGATGEFYKRVSLSTPRFASARGGWRAIPWGEFHGTKDRKSGLLQSPADARGWPVYGGASFDIWQPEAWKESGALSYVADPQRGLKELQRKRERSPVWRANFRAEVIHDPGSLPVLQPRILYRKVSRSTDSRTVRCALVPPQVFSHEAAISLIWPEGDERDVAFLLGVLSSVPLDWFARRRVEVNLNQYILEALPIPRPGRSDDRWSRVVELSARLSCIDDRYSEFLERVGVAFRPATDDEKAEMVAELDAVVSHLYGITRDELEAVFNDFPATRAGVSPGRRAATLNWYDRWAS